MNNTWRPPLPVASYDEQVVKMVVDQLEVAIDAQKDEVRLLARFSPYEDVAVSFPVRTLSSLSPSHTMLSPHSVLSSSTRSRLDNFVKRLSRHVHYRVDGNVELREYYLLGACEYILRVKRAKHGILNVNNIYWFYCCALLLVSKYCEDEPFRGKEWADVCFMSFDTLHSLESEIVRLINWNLYLD